MRRSIPLFILLFSAHAAVAMTGETSRTRVILQKGTVFSDQGTCLRGGTVYFSKQLLAEKQLYAYDPVFWKQMRTAGLNAVRIACLTPWMRAQQQSHFDLSDTSEANVFLAHLEKAVQLAAENDMYALIQYHGSGTDQKDLLRFWSLVAPRFADRAHVLYEATSEPVSPTTTKIPRATLDTVAQVYKQIRASAPDTHIALLTAPQGTPSLVAIAQDLKKRGVSWENASLAIHAYGKTSLSALETIRAAAPVLITDVPPPTVDTATRTQQASWFIRSLENAGISWFASGIATPEALSRLFESNLKDDASYYGYLWDHDRMAGKVAFRVPLRITPQTALFEKHIDVKIIPLESNSHIRYTLDGTRPDTHSLQYTKPIRISGTGKTVLKAALENTDRTISPICSRAIFQQIRQPDAPTQTAPGAICELYTGRWSRLPDFTSLTPLRVSPASEINTSKREGHNDLFGFRFHGYLKIPAKGTYRFSLRSDDGSRLFIGKQLLIDHDGLHGMTEKQATLPLGKGFHHFELVMFECTGGEGLLLEWEGPTIQKSRVPSSVLFHEPAALAKAKKRLLPPTPSSAPTQR